MHIVCPHCTTSYEVNPASFGEAGRTVRCSRCKETWLAHPEELASAEAPVPSLAAADGAGNDPDDAGWGDLGADDDGDNADTPAGRQPVDFGRLAGRTRSPSEWLAQAQDEARTPRLPPRRAARCWRG